MRQTIITLVLIFLTIPVSAGERIPGTKVSLDPPPGFVKTTQFPGYMMESTGSSILVSEIPGPFSEVSKGFTKDGFAGRGMTLMDKKEVEIASGNAVLLQVGQSARGTRFLKWFLGCGDKNASVLVVATFPEEFETELSESLKKALLSTKWDPTLTVGFFEGLTFKVDEGGDLKVANKMGNNIFLTRNGAFPNKAMGDPLVIVGASVSQDWRVPGDQKAFAKKRLTQTETLRNIKVASEKSVEIDGLNGYLIEAVGEHKDTGSREFIMQCLLFTNDGYYICQGVVSETEKKTYQPVFISILKSFKRK